MGIIEEFVTREGTEYGEFDRSLESKVEGVMKQLRASKVFIVFDDETATCSIVTRDELAPDHKG